MAPSHSSAIVLGASMSGLLAARALSPHFKRVTIVERDALPLGPELRRGVPQAAHAHGLLASGYAVMDGYFPGLMDELDAVGAPRGDAGADFLFFQYGRWKLRHRVGLRGILVSRPCLEAAVRQRMMRLPNVFVLDGTTCVKPIYEEAAGGVVGAIVRSRDGAEAGIGANLVVDATGRGSQSPRWLEEWGFGSPTMLSVKIDIGYATRIFERRPGDFFNTWGGVVSGTPPRDTRLGAVLAAERNRWVVTLVGALGDHPPADEDGWMRFAATLPVPAVHDLVTSARPLSEIVTLRFPANVRHMYERMSRFPRGFLVIGDAISSFNPIYGQGMSVAAMEAKALDETLAGGLDRLARRFYARARKIVDIPWTIATGEDLRYPQVAGSRPPGFHMVNRYMERVHAAASHDAVVLRKFYDVFNLLAPPTSMMKPGMLWRVLTRRVPEGQGSPWGDGEVPTPKDRTPRPPTANAMMRV